QLVLALGAELDLGVVPGLEPAAQTFYTLEGAVRLRAALGRFDGGRIMVLIPRTPFKCPPAPYEAAMMLHATLARRGIRAQLDIWTVEKAPMPTAGPAIGKIIVSELAARGIGYHPGMKAAAVEGARGVVRFENETEVEYELLIAVPPHRAPRVVVEAGLAEPGGWVAVDPATLAVKKQGGGPDGFAGGGLATGALPRPWNPEGPLLVPKARGLPPARGGGGRHGGPGGA